MVKKILIAGYYGMGNLGDELILEFLLRDLREVIGSIGKDFSITVLSGSPFVTSKQYSVNSLPRLKLLSVLRAILTHDMIIVGGGGLFQDKTSNFSLYYYLFLILAGKLLKKRMVVYSVGIDRLKTFNAMLTGCIIKLADFISVRDSVSYDFLTKQRCFLKPKVGRIFFMPDVVLNCRPFFEKDNIYTQKERPVFAFIVKKINNNPPEFWATIADSCIRRFNVEVKFVVFHKLRDYKYTKEIVAFMKNKSEIIFWEKPSDILKEFYNFDMVISVRLHGMILAAVYGIPLCGVSDDIKADLFLKKIAQKNIYSMDSFKDSSYETIMGVISNSWLWRQEFKQMYLKNVERLKIQYRTSLNAFKTFIERNV